MAEITGTEIVVGGLLTAVGAGSSAVLAWFARTIVEVRDHTRIMKQSLHGDPMSKTDTGLMGRVADIAEHTDRAHSRIDDIEPRIEAVEKTCVMIHGNVIMRTQE